MNKIEHLDDSSLIQYLDGELAEDQFTTLRAHLNSCALCRQKMDDFARISARVEDVVELQCAPAPLDSRSRLTEALASGAAFRTHPQNAARVIRRFAWGMTIAATFAVGILLAPRPSQTVKKIIPAASEMASTSIEVNGESFIALPYSNPDLPLNAPRIVEMQVPVASLASAGILLEPAAGGLEASGSEAAGSADRTVLANVLLGVDGQPLGVHVLGTE